MNAALVRGASAAVLMAALLGFGVRADASYGATARLEPARVFNPASESLLGSLTLQIRDMSLLALRVFNIDQQTDLDEIAIAPFAAGAVGVPAIADISLPGVLPVRSYEPTLRLADASQTLIGQAPLLDGSAVFAALPPAFVPSAPALPQVHFGSYAPYTPALQSLAANVRVPMRVGAIHFNGTVSGEQSQVQPDAFRTLQVCGTTDQNAACPYLHESSAQDIVAGTNFNVRAGNRNVNLQISSSVEHVTTGDSAIFSYVPVDPDAQFMTSAAQAAGPDAGLLQYPGLADVIKHGVAAGVNVPITHRITLGLRYNRTHYQGDYGTALLPGVDAYKNTYLGNVSYALPNKDSLITLSARQYFYQDGFSPNFSLTQTRADLSFTVKF